MSKNKNLITDTFKKNKHDVQKSINELLPIVANQIYQANIRGKHDDYTYMDKNLRDIIIDFVERLKKEPTKNPWNLFLNIFEKEKKLNSNNKGSKDTYKKAWQ